MSEGMSSPRDTHIHEATPLVSDLELESAILKGVAAHRPVGQHKHVLIIALQASVHSQTGIWVPVEELWKTLEDLYDLEALDNMSSSTPSLPNSPTTLSPVPNAHRRRPRASASPLSSPPSPPGPSRSAGVIDSRHFKAAFELPLGEESESEDFGELVYARAKGEEEDWAVEIDAQVDAQVKSKRRDSSPLSSDEAPKRGTRKRAHDRESSEESRPAARKSRRRGQ